MKGDAGRQEKPPEKKQEKPRKKADPQSASRCLQGVEQKAVSARNAFCHKRFLPVL
jgi:hypothetical protein